MRGYRCCLASAATATIKLTGDEHSQVESTDMICQMKPD